MFSFIPLPILGDKCKWKVVDDVPVKTLYSIQLSLILAPILLVLSYDQSINFTEQILTYAKCENWTWLEFTKFAFQNKKDWSAMGVVVQ